MVSGQEWKCPQLQAFTDTTALENAHAGHMCRVCTGKSASSEATRVSVLDEYHPLRAAGSLSTAPFPAPARRFCRASRFLLDGQKDSSDSALLGEISEKNL